MLAKKISLNMNKTDKLVQKILNGKNVTYHEAETLLLSLGFQLKISGSHHIFRRAGYPKTISIKKRKQLLDYQIDDLKEVLKNHER